MGYIREMYGTRSKEFIEGFLAAMETYSWWKDGQRFIGSPEIERRAASKEAIIELGGVPEDFTHML